MTHQKWWNRPSSLGIFKFGYEPKILTEYTETYKQHQLRPMESCKPREDNRKSNAPVSDQTTFRVDYVRHPLSKHPQPEKQVYQPPTTAMLGKSMYRQDYLQHQTSPIQLVHGKDTRKPPAAKFEAFPTYASDFKRWQLPSRTHYGPKDEYQKPVVQMEKMSTAQQDYIYRFVPPQESAQPPTKRFQSEEPFQSSTVHNTSFIPHQIEPRLQKTKLKYLPPSVPMSFTTTFQNDFTGEKSAPAESMRPTQCPIVSDDPISNSSEFRDSFVPWPVVRPKHHIPDIYKKPQGEMELQTTQRLDFGLKQMQAKAPKREVMRRIASVPFDATTQYNTNYRRWSIQQRPVKANEEIRKSSAKFDGLSTTKQHYVHHYNIKPTPSCKPTGERITTDAVLDGNTTYRISYVPQSMKEVERYPTPSWLQQSRREQTIC